MYSLRIDQQKSHRHIAHPIAQLYKTNGVDPLFDVFLQDDDNQHDPQQIVKILTVDERGRAILLVHRGDRFTQTCNNIPLYHPYEHITAVKWINADQALIGSSANQIYLLNSTSTDTTPCVLTLYKQTISGPLGFVKSLYTTPIPHASECILPKSEESGPIVNMCTVDETIYVCSHHQVSLWTINCQSEAQVRCYTLKKKEREREMQNTHYKTAGYTHPSPERHYQLYITACASRHQEINAPV